MINEVRVDAYTCQPTQTCGARQYRAADGYSCTTCPQYQRMTANSCEPISCNTGLYLTVEGSCMSCPAGSQVAADGRSCATMTCPMYQRLNVQTNSCQVVQCANMGQYVSIDGNCVTCPAGQQPSADRRSCAPMPCQPNQVRLDNGACGYCPPYTRLQADGQCWADVCNFRSILTEAGTCQTCPLYTAPDATARSCMTRTCNSMQILLEDGTCQDCEWGYERSADGRSCMKTQVVVVTPPTPPPPPPAPVTLKQTCCNCSCGCCGCCWKPEDFLTE